MHSSPLPSQDDSSAQTLQSEHAQMSAVHSAFKTVLHHFKKHVGIGIICAVGYFDPYAISLLVVYMYI
jgi:metal iron transporter